MKKLFKKLALMVVALLTFSVGSNYTVKEVKAEGTTITFELGANGTATHADGNSATTYSETVDGYKLSITGGTNMYTGARDAKGNSCIKMGTSSKAGSFTVSNVPDDVESVIIHVAAYKAKTATVSCNNAKTTLQNKSDNGTYDKITIDTSETKSISFTVTSGYRCMVNTIEFNILESSGGEDEIKPSLSITGKEYAQIGETISLNVTQENLTETIKWTSSNEDVASVSNGVVTANKMGVTTISASADGIEKTLNIKVYPVEKSILTIAQATEVCKLTDQENSPYQYSVDGTVVSIDTSYNSQYNNITVTISDGTNSIVAFRMSGGTDLVIGSIIKVTGKLVNYLGKTPEFVECTYENLGIDYTVTIASKSTTASLGFNYSYTEGVGTGIVEQSSILKFDDVSKRTEYSEEKQVWKDNGIIVTNDKGESTTKVGNYVNPARFYKNSKISICVQLSEESEKSLMTKIEINSGTGEYSTALESSLNTCNANFSVLENNYIITLDEPTTDFSFVASGGQVRFNSITVTYGTLGEVKIYENPLFDNISILFGAEVETSLFEEFDEVSSAGVMFAAGDTLDPNDSDNLIVKEVASLVPNGDVYSIGAEFTVFAEGEYVTEETKSRLSQNITAAVYFIVDGETVILETKTVSVKLMIEKYIKDYATHADVKEHIGGLTALKSYIEA